MDEKESIGQFFERCRAQLRDNYWAMHKKSRKTCVFVAVRNDSPLFETLRGFAGAVPADAGNITMLMPAKSLVRLLEFSVKDPSLTKAVGDYLVRKVRNIEVRSVVAINNEVGFYTVERPAGQSRVGK